MCVMSKKSQLSVPLWERSFTKSEFEIRLNKEIPTAFDVKINAHVITGKEKPPGKSFCMTDVP